MSLLSRSIRREVVYPHPPERVWRALTDSEALAQWLMPNDFQPLVGHRFQFRTDPAPGFDGIVDCEVLEVREPSRLRYTWVGGPVDTVVTFQLEPTPTGHTRLHFEQSGFQGLRSVLVSLILGAGFRKIYKRLLPKVLEAIASGRFSGEAPVEREPASAAGAAIEKAVAKVAEKVPSS